MGFIEHEKKQGGSNIPSLHVVHVSSASVFFFCARRIRSQTVHVITGFFEYFNSALPQFYSQNFDALSIVLLFYKRCPVFLTETKNKDFIV